MTKEAQQILIIIQYIKMGCAAVEIVCLLALMFMPAGIESGGGKRGKRTRGSRRRMRDNPSADDVADGTNHSGGSGDTGDQQGLFR